MSPGYPSDIRSKVKGSRSAKKAVDKCTWNFEERQAFIRVCLSVWMSVCSHDRTKTAEAISTKLATGIVYYESWLPLNIRSKVKVTGSQSAKNIFQLKVIEWPAWVCTYGFVKMLPQTDTNSPVDYNVCFDVLIVVARWLTGRASD